MNSLEKQLNEYINNTTYNYGFLINGQWGAGKSYFINEFKEKYKGEKIFLKVTLNGLKTIEDIDIKIIEELIANFGKDCFEGLSIKSLTKQINSKNITKLLKKDYPNILINSALDIITDTLSKEKVILIFDDLERCKIVLDELFAYINHYIEIQKMKVIIIANEKEIDPAKNLNYSSIKEKFIGHTVEYIPNVSDIYFNSLKEEKNKDLINILQENEKNLIDELNNQNHLNMRTVQFIIDKFTNLYKIVLMNSKYKDNKDINEVIFKYLVFISIAYKNGEKLFNWENSEFGYMNLKEDFNSKNYRYGFKFIDDYITTGKLDEEKIIETLDEYADNLIPKDNPYNLLKNEYWEMEDKDIYIMLNQIMKFLEDGTYKTGNILDILILILKLEDRGYNINVKNFIELSKNILRRDDINNILQFENEFVNFSDANEMVIRKYKKIVEDFGRFVFELKLEDLEESIKRGEYNKLYDEITTNNNFLNFIATNGFFSNVDINMLTTSIQESKKVIEIMYFKYFYDNLIDDFRYRQIYDKEKEHINKLIGNLKNIKIEDNIGKNNAIKSVIVRLEKGKDD